MAKIKISELSQLPESTPVDGYSTVGADGSNNTVRVPLNRLAEKEDLDGKVDKVDGKGLSENDFTNELKTKLEGVSDGANKTIVDSTLNDSSANPVQNKVITNELAITKEMLQAYVNGMYTAERNGISIDLTMLSSVNANYAPKKNFTIFSLNANSPVELNIATTYSGSYFQGCYEISLTIYNNTSVQLSLNGVLVAGILCDSGLGTNLRHPAMIFRLIYNNPTGAKSYSFILVECVYNCSVEGDSYPAAIGEDATLMSMSRDAVSEPRLEKVAVISLDDEVTTEEEQR